MKESALAPKWGANVESTKSMKTIAIMQARLGSTRLPRKVLADIAGHPLLHHVFSRASAAGHISGSLLATTDAPEDDELADWARSEGIAVYRGSVNDVLDRYYHAALSADADVIVRITADDAMKDPSVIDRVIDTRNVEKHDYCSNALTPSYPEGMDVEVFTFDALERAHKSATQEFEREHVTPFIWQNPAVFSLGNVSHSSDLSHMRWTIDTEEDLAFARAVYDELFTEQKMFGFQDVLSLLDRRPDIAQLMPEIPRNQGLTTSMEKNS